MREDFLQEDTCTCKKNCGAGIIFCLRLARDGLKALENLLLTDTEERLKVLVGCSIILELESRELCLPLLR